MANFCYIPQKGIDDVLAAKLGWRGNASDKFNPFRVATLRGMYDEIHQNSPLNTTNLDEAALTLAKFRQEIKIGNQAKINSIGTNLAPSYKSLKKAFTAEERFNRVNMIAAMFSAVVDEIQRNNPQLSRRAIIDTKVGEFNLFEKVYNQIMQMQSIFRAKGDMEKAAKFNQVLSNWSALTAFARMKLRDTEGIKLGNKIEFADETDELNYGDNDLSQLFNPSESVREAWQTSNGLESAFGSVGQQVRRLLSSLPIMEIADVTTADGRVVQKPQPKRDDLGFVQTLDPVKVHQALMELLRGITSEAQMMGAFRNPRTGQAKSVWMIPILDALTKNPQLRTQFFRDFKKNFQPYSILIEDKEASKKGLRKYKTKLLNRVEDLLGGSFMSRIILGKPLNAKTSVFDTKGNVNVSNLKNTLNQINEWLAQPKEDTGSIFDKQKQYGGGKQSKFYSRGGSSIERRAFLRTSLESLGVEVDADTLDEIMNHSKDLRKLTNALQELAQYGVSENQLKRLEAGEKISYKSLVRAKSQNSRKEGVFEEKIRKIHEMITKNREGLRLESRVRHKDSKGNNITLFSNVNPSFMGDKFDKIQSYVKANDKAGLRSFITNEYLDSPFFSYNGKVLNKWLEELLKCCDTPVNVSLEDTFAAQFDYLRFLGTSDMSFENFTSKQHMIDMFTEFRSDKELSNKADTALYPVFILGDSGVSKYIRAKRYSNEEIMDGLYNAYEQERRRQELVKATNEWLDSRNYSKVENFSDSEDTFSILGFLNKDYKASDGTVGKYSSMLSDRPTETEVKKAISAYLSDALKDFKKQISNLGLLETIKVKEIDRNNKQVEVERYTYLGEGVTSENLDEKLAEFYNNVKFATINQLQLMTIDTSFYKGTKDLQKRYKEIHAPGSLLSLSALDSYGKKFSEDGIERCVYFDDINVNAEQSNPEFMEAIAAVHGKDSDVYKAYKRNTLTDGQGYRTLRSYRKVMGMAGQWTEEMQKVYEAIEQLRVDYNGKSIPSEKLAEIASMAVVFQPIKPYMFTHEKLALNDKDKVIIPVQHKYAEAVLIPELLPEGSKLRDIAYWMDNNNVDLVGSTKIVKVGGFGSTAIDYETNDENLYVDSNGNVIPVASGKALTRENQMKNDNFSKLAVPIKGVDKLHSNLSKAYIHQLSYSDYRIQTNVPEHINSSQLFGTQVRKLIMANINMDDYHYMNYIGGDGTVNLGGNHGRVKLNGRNLVSFYNGLIVANILESFDSFKDGISDANKLSEKLIQGVINNSRESMDNILAYAVDDDKFAMPLFEGGLEHDAAAMAFSMFKKVVNKQQIKGGSAVQVSAMGIKGYEEDGDLKYVTDDKGNILYAECEIPFDISYKDSEGNEVHLDFNEYCNPDGTLKMIESEGKKISLLEHRFPGSTSLLAYRIPTERDYSMLNLRVKRFSQKTAGGTIKVPAQGTTIAGFDFDIDKLYFMRREYRALKKQSTDEATDALLSAVFSDDTSQLIDFEEYDFNKSPLENTRAARNNMLITLIQQRLMDSETMKQRTTPGGFANASKSARIMRELLYGSTEGIIDDNKKVNWEVLNNRAKDKSSDPEPNYDPSDPMTIITYNQQNQVASKLIGIFANQNTNHAFASLMKSFKISKPIEFAGHSYGDGKFSDFLHAPNGVDVDLNVAEFLAASVDAVKDPVLNFMNLNTLTADAGAVLARIGYTTTEIGMLFNQPIIKEVCEYSFNNNVGIDTAIREIREKYKNQGASVKSRKEPLNPEHFSMDKLTKNILNDRVLRKKGNNVMDNNTFATEQLEVLDLFNDISAVANDVSAFVTSTKFTASNAVGSTFGDLYSQQLKVQKYLSEVGTEASHVEMEVTDNLDSPIMNDNSLTTMNNSDYLDTMMGNPFAYEQAMFDANRKALEILSRYFPYNKEAYVNARNTLNELVNYGSLDADTINSIHSDMMVYLLSNQERSEFNGSLPKQTQHGLMTTRGYYTKWFAKDLLGHLEANPQMKSIPIFAYMIPEVKEVKNPATGESTDEISINIQGIGGLAPYMKDEIRESWADLARNPETSQIAIDLFLYNFYKLGFNFSPKAFMNLAPTEVKEMLKVPSNNENVLIYKGKPLTLYRGYATEGGVEAKDIDETVKGSAVDYIDSSFNAKYHFTEQEDAEMYSQIHEEEHHKNGKTGYKRVTSKYWLSSDTSYKVYKDIIDANKHKEEWGNIDAIILENGTLGDGQYEVIVTSNAKDKILSSTYSRSYVDFMNEIMEDKFNINAETFARQYMLNHLDNKRFGLDAKSKTVLNILKPLAIQAGVARNEFTLDLSKIDKENGKYFILKENKMAKSRQFVPMIKINTGQGQVVYMADSFGETKTSVMTYHKVDKLGTKGQSLQYFGDNISSDIVEDTEVSETFEEGSTSESSEERESTVEGFDREAVINEIAEEMSKAYEKADIRDDQGELYTANALKAALSNTEEADLKASVEELRQACRVDGVIVLDENGNPMKAC